MARGVLRSSERQNQAARLAKQLSIERKKARLPASSIDCTAGPASHSLVQTWQTSLPASRPSVSNTGMRSTPATLA